MNFDFDINGLIPYEITIYDSKSNILNELNHDDNIKLSKEQKSKLGLLFNAIGEQSAQSQGLKEIITSQSKLLINESHRIYLMKDPHGNNGKGSLIGLLKVGRKRLFVYDNQGRQHELQPLCLLDFYIHTDQQRKGYGRKLFDYMLRFENIQPKHIAIDTPSSKSIRFLNKHYNLSNPIPQVNNFVVFNGFFEERTDMGKNRRFNLETYSITGGHTNNGQQSPFHTLPPITVADYKSSSNFRSTSMESRIDQNSFKPNGYAESPLYQKASPYLTQNSQQGSKRNSAALEIEHPSRAESTDYYQTPKILAPIENEQKPINPNFLNYKYNPFPSLNPNKPSFYQFIEQDTHNNSYFVQYKKKDTEKAASTSQLNNYSAFPSLNPGNLMYPTTQTKAPSNAYKLDKYRKTKLW